MKRRLLRYLLLASLTLATLFLSMPPMAHAEFIKFIEVNLQNAATATGNGQNISVDYYNSVALQVTISNSATVTFEGSADGSAFVSLVCISLADTTRAKVVSSTATGLFQCNVSGLTAVRARISAYASGSVTVNARATTAVFTTN